jgi:flagellin
MADAMMKISSGQRINSAKDDASGLAIMEKMEAQIRGLDKGIDNTLDMKNLAVTAEGGLAGIDDSLQRVRELTIQAGSGIYTDSDRSIIQSEIDQLLRGINDIAKNTEFNAQKLLDGSFTNKNTASGPDGRGTTVNIPDMTTFAIGLQGYNVTNMKVSNPDEGPDSLKSNLNKLDGAMASVSEARSYLGAIENGFDYTVNSNSTAMLNLAASKSRIADLDFAKGVSDMEKGRVLTEMSIYNQKNQQNMLRNQYSLLM